MSNEIDSFNPILFFYNDKTNIENFTILGERHSGTNWLESLCKYNLNLPITWEYGFKHFINLNWNTYYKSEKTLFFCIVRDIYTWIPAFFRQPHHVNSNIAYNINNFLSKEWSSFDTFTKQEILEDRNYITLLRYKNIFDLRNKKLKFYYYYLPYLINNFIIIRYEDLLLDPYSVFEWLQKRTNININITKNSFLDSKGQKFYKDKQGMKKIINTNANWDIENIYKYYKKD
jgi:hypothetical protein